MRFYIKVFLKRFERLFNLRNSIEAHAKLICLIQFQYTYVAHMNALPMLDPISTHSVS